MMETVDPVNHRCSDKQALESGDAGTSADSTTSHGSRLHFGPGALPSL